MDNQQQRRNDESPSRSKRAIHHGFDQGRTNQSKEETSTAHNPKKQRPSSLSLPPDQKASEATRIRSRNLAPTQLDNSSAALQNVPQQAPSAQSVFMPTPPSLSTSRSRPNRIEDLLNPTARDTTSAGGRQHDGNGMDSRWTAPIAATSRPATPPPTAVGQRPSRDISLPSITPALRDQASASIGLGLLLPSEIMEASDTLRAAHPPPAPRPSPRVQTQSVRTGRPASRNSSPSSAIPQIVSTSEPQSHFSAPFTAMGPAPTLPQVALDKRAFDVTRSEVSHQSQYCTSDPEQVPIPVSLDLRAGSKAADRKRLRKRQRRKEKEQEVPDQISELEAQLREISELEAQLRETSELEEAQLWETSELEAQLRKILELEAQLREITAEKERYQRDRDFWQEIDLENRIPVPPRPPSARRRRHASLSEPHIADTETAQIGDRNALRHTNPYLPQG